MESYRHTYCFFLWMLFIVGCGKMPMTKEFKNNNRSSKFDARDFKPELIRFLDYRVFKETSLVNDHEDSIIRSGIILRGASVEQNHMKKEVLFGKEADTCSVQYVFNEKYYHDGRSAALSVANLLSKKSNRVPQEDKYTNLSNDMTGTIKHPSSGSQASFTVYDIRDVRKCAGHLIINSDTFLLGPVAGASLLLSKGDTTYAMMQKTIMNRIYIYTKASSSEQMLIAAYFVVIERFW